MRDYNFFEEYIFKSKRVPLDRLVMPFIFVIIIGSIIGVFVFNLSVLNNLEAEHEANVSIINSSKYIDKMADLENARTKLALIQAIQAETEAFELIITTDYVVTEEITEMIAESIPRNVSFNTYSITSSGVDITGSASDYSYVAELENNLRNLDKFSNIFVSFINADSPELLGEAENLVLFSINLSIGGESND